MKTFKPFQPVLFPNKAVSIEDLPQKQYMCSIKKDGIRNIFFDDGRMLSRSLKQIQNKQLQEKFSHIKEWCKKTNIILDGELYNHSLPEKYMELDAKGKPVEVDRFQQISSLVMTQDFHDEKTIKLMNKRKSYLLRFYKDGVFHNPLEFHCFDALLLSNPNEPFMSRLHKIPTLPGIVIVFQRIIESKALMQILFEQSLNDGYEGLMLRDPQSAYKYGRFTINSGDGFKLKNYKTFDAQVIGVEQATKVNPNAEKKTNELGYSETSKKKSDRILVEAVGSLFVTCNGKEQKVNFCVTDEEKKQTWINREKVIGRWIEFKAMVEGSKDKLRIPTFVRWRPDRD